MPSFIFTLLTAGGCFWYAETYQEPHKWQRLLSNYSTATATIIGLISVNLAVFALWRFPPAWRFLNRYFICVPAVPYAPSVLGAAFSHQEVGHLFMNMAILSFIGTRRKFLIRLRLVSIPSRIPYLCVDIY